MNHYHTTQSIRRLMASGAVLATREVDPIEVLTRSFEAHNTTVIDRLTRSEQALAEVKRDVDRIGNRVIPAHSRQARIGERNLIRSAALPSDSGGSRASGDDDTVEATRQEHAALATFVRTGEARELTELSTRSGEGMSVDSDPDGGWTVLPVVSSVIQRRTFDRSPMARLARRVTIDTGDSFEEPIDADDIGAEWVGEKALRPPLTTAQLKYLKVPLNEIYTNQPVTQKLLDLNSFNLGGWLEDKISDKFARSEGAGYINGDGVEKPMGLLFRPTSSAKDGTRDYFTIQHINTGVGGGFALANAGTGISPADALIDAVYSLRAPYRPNARWLMNLATAGVVRKLKDSEGRFIWQESTQQGQPAMLLGFPVELDEEMPDIDANSLSIAFGDFQQAYIIVEKPGLRLLIDPYTMKPHVLFYAYRRVGGQVQNGEAVKLVRFAAAD